ncbi:MAG: glycoside hydrolase family 5 protein [Treponema sp.]|nr:glycoside hydrolase family 5 protein [Treponema sp.]
MKKIKFILSAAVLILLTSCAGKVATEPENEFSDSKPKPTKLTGWNDAEVAEYAKFFNKLCREAGYTGFWWDCNDLINRKELSCRQQIVDAIMSQYPAEDFTYTKTTAGFVEEDAATAVHNMKTGWNLGNTLDATSYDWKKEGTDEIGWILQWGEKRDGKVTTKAFETAWGMPVTTREMIHYVKECGFNAVRIPCTWAEHIDENNQIDAEWMARVHQVVDYVIDEGMYCILNTHHDGWVCASENMYNKYSKRFETVWTQIAQEFKDYDERLIFASMNEVTDEKDSWNPPASTFKYINMWNQLFINTIRAQGGNHAKRNLVISPRGCSGSDRDMQILDQVTDPAENHLIIEVHNYTPQGFCFNNATWTTMTAKWRPMQHEYDIRNDFNMYARWQKRINRPVIIGEYAAFPKKYEDYD